MNSFDFNGLPATAVLTVFSPPAPSNVWRTPSGEAYGAGFTWANGIITGNGSCRILPPNSPGYGNPTQAASVNNINLCLFATANGLLKQLSFTYWNYGGNLNLLVNGDFVNINSFGVIHGRDFAGAVASVTENHNMHGVYGTVKFDGAIREQRYFGHIAVGGQELVVDDFVWD